VIDLLKAYCRIEARDDTRRIREKVTGKLLTLDETLRPALPAFLALLDVPVDDAPWQALDPPQRRQRTLDAVKRLLLRESQVQPLLEIFEECAPWSPTATSAWGSCTAEQATGRGPMNTWRPPRRCSAR
jgi:hypothetical protein